MKYLIFFILSVVSGAAAHAKPRCQGFNNNDDKELQATSVKTAVKDGVATVTLRFPHVTQFSNPKVTLRINGKKQTFKVCQ